MANTIKDLNREASREKRSSSYKKDAGTISDARVYSCYIVSAVIVGLCIYEIFSGDEIVGGSFTYVFLAAAAVVFSVIITVRNNEAKKSKNKNKKH